jgi:site-specific DNA-methyltransferase (adenine-specific)
MESNIYLGDCLDIMANIKSGSIDLVVTDPPYKLTQGGCKSQAINGHFKTQEKIATDGAKNGKIFKHNDIDFKDWMPEVYRILKNQTHFYCMCNAKNLQSVLNTGTNSNFIVQTVLVWSKGMHTPSQYYLPNIEFIVLFRKCNAKYINEMGTKALIEINGIRNKKHPSEKPVDLFSVFVRNSSNKNDIVLDPFAGHGSLALACLKTERNFIVIEKDPNYFEEIKKRVGDFNKKFETQTLFGNEI